MCKEVLNFAYDTKERFSDESFMQTVFQDNKEKLLSVDENEHSLGINLGIPIGPGILGVGGDYSDESMSILKREIEARSFSNTNVKRIFYEKIFKANENVLNSWERCMRNGAPYNVTALRSIDTKIVQLKVETNFPAKLRKYRISQISFSQNDVLKFMSGDFHAQNGEFNQTELQSDSKYSVRYIQSESENSLLDNFEIYVTLEEFNDKGDFVKDTITIEVPRLYKPIEKTMVLYALKYRDFPGSRIDSNFQALGYNRGDVRNANNYLQIGRTHDAVIFQPSEVMSVYSNFRIQTISYCHAGKCYSHAEVFKGRLKGNSIYWSHAGDIICSLSDNIEGTAKHQEMIVSLPDEEVLAVGDYSHYDHHWPE